MACIKRTVDDVESLLEFAKINGSSLLSTSQTLEFPNNCNLENYTLMQLPEKLITVLKKGDKLIFRGDADDDAVLCTDNETFEVREAETSNSLLLVPNIKLPEALKDKTDTREVLHKKVCGIHYKYLELRPCIPRLHKLRSLLHEAPYAGLQQEEDDSNQHRQYTFSELLDRVQCSDEELRDALLALPAMHIGGHWRVLEFGYQFGVLSAILGLIEEQQWPLDAVPQTEVLQRLKGTEPSTVLKLCLDYFFDRPGTESAEADTSPGLLCRLNDTRICRLFAEVLLKPAAKFNLEEFTTIWPQSVPPGVNTSLDQLDGLALVDRSTAPGTICYYPDHQLPEEPSDRFIKLFQTRDRWTLTEIAPYIKELSSAKLSVNALLGKYTRASTHNGIKYFSAKHSK